MSDFPKVLVVSTNAWRENTGINTLINLFKNWDAKKIAQIYTRSSLPSTKVCDEFFRISEKLVLKSVLNRKIKTGGRVQNEHDGGSDAQKESEISLYASKRGLLTRALSLCREIVWFLGKWKTRELDEFLKTCNPDVLFIPIYPTIYMGRIQKYIVKKTGKPIVSYIADDNYTFKCSRKDPVALIERTALRRYVRFLVKHSKKLLVIAPKQKEVYDRIFKTESAILTKGIDFTERPFVEKDVARPVKMVYTGKLIIGRWKSLARIAEALGKINADETKITLDVYTTDVLTDKQRATLNRNGSVVRGALSLSEVQKVQEEADVLVFVESLERRYRKAAWLSFSTKITDYLQNGKCILAIGDEEIAPIDYFRRYSSAIVATSYDEIEKRLEEIASNPELIKEMAKKAYDCGVRNHSEKEMNGLLTNVIKDAVLSKA